MFHRFIILHRLIFHQHTLPPILLTILQVLPRVLITILFNTLKYRYRLNTVSLYIIEIDMDNYYVVALKSHPKMSP